MPEELDAALEKAAAKVQREAADLKYRKLGEEYLQSITGQDAEKPDVMQTVERYIREHVDEELSVVNLFCWGVEGKHYVVTSEENKEIALPEGKSQTEVGYMALGLYGDQNIMYQMGTNPVADNEVWTKEAESRKTKGYGFCYDSSAMTNQIIAVEAVISEYLPALETGSANLDSVYPEFLNKLEANGINDIIADKQAQFDAWLAQQ
ncbi:MAG: DUF3502 domain-containing protein [Lachnospiraceae bacterium]|nr:DUF3502 domain-containing protein [Lachnospiraceae bacterium]